jgi:hypothetical protein
MMPWPTTCLIMANSGHGSRYKLTQTQPENAMSAVLSPIVSEFETEEQATSYDRWFRAKVQAAIDDPRPGIPHDQVMAEMHALIEEKRKKHDARKVES